MEGLNATTSDHQRSKINEWRIKEIVKAYGQVRNNLNLDEPGFPTSDYLQSVIKAGIPKTGWKDFQINHEVKRREDIIKEYIQRRKDY